MRRTLSALLALTLTAPLLAACGQHPLPTAPLSRQSRGYGARSLDAAGLASQFADAMKAEFTGTITLSGSRVSLTEKTESDPITVVYDFSHTPESGLVVMTSGDYTDQIPLSELWPDAPKDGQATSKILPVLLVPITVHMAIAAAQALAVYWVTHRGDAFDKSDAVKTVVVAMGVSVLPFVGEVKYLGTIAPYAVKLVASADSFAFKDLAKAALGMSGELIPVVLDWYKHRHEKSDALSQG